jgi:hypothetical protein
VTAPAVSPSPLLKHPILADLPFRIPTKPAVYSLHKPAALSRTNHVEHRRLQLMIQTCTSHLSRSRLKPTLRAIVPSAGEHADSFLQHGSSVNISSKHRLIKRQCPPVLCQHHNNKRVQVRAPQAAFTRTDTTRLRRMMENEKRRCPAISLLSFAKCCSQASSRLV